MKKLRIAAGLVIAAMAAGFIACAPKADTPAADQPADAQAAPAQALNIRYVDYDTLLSRYTLARELADANQQMMVDYQRQGIQRQNALQNKANDIEQKRQRSLYLSQESFDADVNALQRMDNEASTWAANRETAMRNEAAFRAQRLQDSIDNYIREYSIANGYDAVLIKASGLYFNPSLDVTDEVVAGLNARYTPAPKK